MKNVFVSFVILMLASGCGTAVVATAGKQSVGAQLQASPKAPGGVTSTELAQHNCDGVPDDRCRTYQNMLGPGKAIVELAVGNRRARLYPMGGKLPLPRLLDRQMTRVAFEGCDRRDQYGDCVFDVWAKAYDTINRASRTDDPIMRELLTVPVAKPAYEHCYWMAVTIRDQWDGTPISHHWRFNSVPCPSQTKVVVPTMAAATQP